MTTLANFHDLTDVAEIPAALLARTEADLSSFIEKVKPIIEAVRLEGDAALARFARSLDRVEAAEFSVKVSEAEIAHALATLAPDVREAIEFAITNIRTFHEEQKPEEVWFKEVRPGVWAGDRSLPIESVACYVPRGKGSFPSVTMMTTIPARVAAVEKIIVLTPPGPDGTVDAGTLVACHLIGVTDIFKCGGAQAVAAATYGTETIPKCLKILGPGSPFVVAAKRLLADLIDTGTPAGPSESIILADETANGAIAALDLIIESEHGPDSSAYLVTNSRKVAEEARAALVEHWAAMEPMRADFSRTVLTGAHGGIILTRDIEAAIAFVNAYAPEHLEILVRDPFETLGRIRNASEILMGQNTPITLGNFVLGPNCVLPTNGRARTASPLSVHDFIKRQSVAYVTESAYAEHARHAHALAVYESFNGHARAVSQVREKLKR